MKRWRVLGAAVCIAVSSLLSAQIMAADSQEITFNIKILKGTCTVQATDVPFGDLSGAEAPGQNWVPLGGIRPLQVTLSNCSGASTVGTPKLTLSPAAGSEVLASSNNTLFRDVTSTSRGLGIGVYKTATPDTASGKDLFVSNVAVPIGGAGASWASLNRVYDYAAGVLCGSDCTPADLGSGTLKANVIFTLSYD